MKKIILFDIDGTLFNPRVFLELFYSNLSNTFGLDNNSKNQLQSIYEQIRNLNGYFIPDLFLEAILAKYPQIEAEKLDKIFWNIDLFEKSLYKDTSIVRNLNGLAVIGIFSKGDKKFQEYKLSLIKDIVDQENIYIFPDKISKITEVLNNNKHYEIYMVDDDISVLLNAKNINNNVHAILIDRKEEYEDNINIIPIQSLDRMKEII